MHALTDLLLAIAIRKTTTRVIIIASLTDKNRHSKSYSIMKGVIIKQ